MDQDCAAGVDLGPAAAFSDRDGEDNETEEREFSDLETNIGDGAGEGDSENVEGSWWLM